MATVVIFVDAYQFSLMCHPMGRLCSVKKSRVVALPVRKQSSFQRKCIRGVGVYPDYTGMKMRHCEEYVFERSTRDSPTTLCHQHVLKSFPTNRVFGGVPWHKPSKEVLEKIPKP